MLENIFQEINQKGEEKIQDILADKKKMIAVLEKEFVEGEKTMKTKERLAFQEKAENEIKEFRQMKILETRFAIQHAKQKILDEVYEKTVEKLHNLPSEEFKKMITNMVNALPKDVNGKIYADAKTAAVVKGVSGEIPEHGLIYKSPKLEIDLRFSEIVKQKKEEVEPELNRILFS